MPPTWLPTKPRWSSTFHPILWPFYPSDPNKNTLNAFPNKIPLKYSPFCLIYLKNTTQKIQNGTEQTFRWAILCSFPNELVRNFRRPGYLYSRWRQPADASILDADWSVYDHVGNGNRVCCHPCSTTSRFLWFEFSFGSIFVADVN